MERHQDKQQENAARAVSSRLPAGVISRFPDFRAAATTQRQLQQMADNSPRIGQLKTIQAMADKSAMQRFAYGAPIQKMGGLEEEELLQGKFAAPLQRMGGLEEEEPLQGKFQTVQRQKSNTGLPDQLKSGVENLSGISMDDVQVHYNSARPAPLQAHAYTQGADIHVAPGQERHLAHEAWHVVQQKQGRVQPTMSFKGQNINDSPGLEREADVMGAKAQSSAPQQFRLKKR